MISVDTKKKELIGPYKNGGSDYRLQGCPDEVNVHDFVDKELGKAIPYGVYDIGANAGCVSVGIDHDTAEFAVNAIRRWRDTMGGERYPRADRLMITADGGGSNGSRVRLWKVELQKFADDLHHAMIDHYARGDDAGLEPSSNKALARVWKAQRFSWWMTTLLHKFPQNSPYENKLQDTDLQYLFSSEMALGSLAENYVGLPF